MKTTTLLKAICKGILDFIGQAIIWGICLAIATVIVMGTTTALGCIAQKFGFNPFDNAFAAGEAIGVILIAIALCISMIRKRIKQEKIKENVC